MWHTWSSVELREDDFGMTDRTYGDDELRKILAVAARNDATSPQRRSPVEGLTLSQIQHIAREVGLSTEAVAKAAAALDLSASRPRTSLGLPIEVRRAVPLERELADEEWARLVAEARRVFGARGRVTVHGSLREWSNGNLHVSVEPTGERHQLRMGTVKGDAWGINALGLTGIAAGMAILGVTAIGSGEPSIAGALVLGVSGTAAIITNLIRLPRWARLRGKQMAQLELAAQTMLESGRVPSDPWKGEAGGGGAT
jgi:hypothetical protein